MNKAKARQRVAPDPAEVANSELMELATTYAWPESISDRKTSIGCGDCRAMVESACTLAESSSGHHRLVLRAADIP